MTEEYLRRKRAYIQSYNKKTYRSMSITFRVDDPDEMAIYEFLRSRYSTVQFIKDVVKEAMKKESEQFALFYFSFFYLISKFGFFPSVAIIFETIVPH